MVSILLSIHHCRGLPLPGAHTWENEGGHQGEEPLAPYHATPYRICEHFLLLTIRLIHVCKADNPENTPFASATLRFCVGVPRTATPLASGRHDFD